MTTEAGTAAAAGAEAAAAAEAATAATETAAATTETAVATETATAGAETETAAAAAPPDWRDRRIAQLTARLREEQGKNKNTVTTAETGAAAAPTVGSPEYQAAVREEAGRVAAQTEFNRQCTEVAAAGRLAFPDFDSKVNSLAGALVDQTDPASIQAYTDLVAAAIETGEAPRLLHSLGSDLNEAARVLALPPVKRAVELTKLAAGLAGDSGTSRAPKPITPVGKRVGADATIDPTDPSRSDHLSTKEWMKRREAQVNTARGRA